MWIMERLFKNSLGEDDELIYDRFGKRYQISWGTHHGLGPKLYVYYKGKLAGTIESLWDKQEKDVLDIADVVIFEHYSKLRGRGLGKAMIKAFLSQARKSGAQYLWGFIHPHDGGEMEYLKEWYSRQGFDVYEAKPGIFHIRYFLNSKM